MNDGVDTRFTEHLGYDGVSDVGTHELDTWEIDRRRDDVNAHDSINPRICAECGR